MTVIDERGRLFGRLNAIDAIVAVFILLLIPLAYGAYVLFRPQAVRISSVEPNVVEQGVTPRIQFRGENFRPFLRAQFGNEQLHDFLVGTPSSAEATMPALPSGTYDFALYSEAQEIFRLPKAITVLPPAKPAGVTVQLAGSFVGLSAERAAAFKVHQRFPAEGSPVAEILELGPPRPDVRRLRVGDAFVFTRTAGTSLPAVLRAYCTVVEAMPKCRVGDVQVMPGLVLPLPAAGDFVIDEVRGDNPSVDLEIDVRFVGFPDLIRLLRVGDVEAAASDRSPTLTAVGSPQPVAAEITQHTTSGSIAEEVKSQERLSAANVTMRLSAESTPRGFMHLGLPVKAGATFGFETAQYSVRGTILRVAARPGGKDATR
jgi:hypothetical protein